MKPYVKKYIEQGIKIFACYPDKKPTTKTGFYAASLEVDVLEKQFVHDNFLIGIPTGTMNGLVVIDIDVKDGRTVDELLEELREIVPVPDTYAVATPSGGRHLYFLAPDTKLSSSVRFFGKHLSIDIRANGGYVCAPDGISEYIVYDDVDDKDIDDIRSRCTPLPVEIETFQKTYSGNSESATEILPESEIREIRSALAFLSSDDRDEWVRAGLELKSTGSTAAYGLWNEWSQKSEKYNPADMEKRWKGLKPKDITIASLFFRAKSAGWTTTYERKDLEKILLPEDKDDNDLEPIQQLEKEIFPEELLFPKGLVGDIAKYIVDTAIKPQPIFALAAALSAVGTLAGQKVQTETEIRTNIYCLCVGASGSGKESPRSTLKKLFHLAGCGDMAKTEDIASDASITNSLSKNPSQLFLLDEIGRFIKTTTGPNRPTHLYNVVSVLLKLYSNANGVFNGKIYADSKNQVEIIQPNLCLYGTTVPDTLYKGLTVENVTDGFLARMLIFETDNNRPRKARRRNLIIAPPVEIINQMKALKRKPINFSPEGNLDHMNPIPQVIPLVEDAQEMLERFDDYIEDLRDDLEKKNKIESIYNRSSQLAEQIALILAVGRNIDQPTIGNYEMSYGIRLAEYLSKHMAYIVDNYIAANEHEHDVKRILNAIRITGKIKKSDLTKKTQNLKGYDRNDMIDTLIESKQIEQTTTGNGPKKTIWYNIRGYKEIEE